MLGEIFDSIKVISEGLTAINLRLADLLPDSLEYQEIERLRNKTHDLLRDLTREFSRIQVGDTSTPTTNW